MTNPNQSGTPNRHGPEGTQSGNEAGNQNGNQSGKEDGNPSRNPQRSGKSDNLPADNRSGNGSGNTKGDDSRRQKKSRRPGDSLQVGERGDDKGLHAKEGDSDDDVRDQVNEGGLDIRAEGEGEDESGGDEGQIGSNRPRNKNDDQRSRDNSRL